MFPSGASRVLWNHSGFFQCSEYFFSDSWLLTFKWNLTLPSALTSRHRKTKAQFWIRRMQITLMESVQLWTITACELLLWVRTSVLVRWFTALPFLHWHPSLDNELHLLAAGEHMNHSIIPHQPPVLDFECYSLLSYYMIIFPFYYGKRWYLTFRLTLYRIFLPSRWHHVWSLLCSPAGCTF